MRVTQLFTILAFFKSLEQIHLSPELTPSFLGSGVSLSSWPPALFKILPYPDLTPSFLGSGLVSLPSWSPALLNVSSHWVDTHVEVPVLPTVVAPVQVTPPVIETKKVNAPTCIFYISQIARPRFSPAPVIPPRPQPVCLNRHIHPKFEAPGPKSPWIIPSPFPPPSKLPKAPFCLPSDKTDSENNDDNSDNNESIWLSLILAPIVFAVIWHLSCLLAPCPIFDSALQPESVDNQGVEPMPWSRPNAVMVRRKKVECRARVTQPRVFISTLPSLPAGSDALVSIPPRLTEFDASATLSLPVFTPKTETSSPPLDLTETTVTDLLFGIVPPPVDRAEKTTSLCTLSPIPSSSAEPSFEESVLQPSLSLRAPTLSTSPLPPLVFEESQFYSVSKPDSASASPSLPACENTIDASTVSLPSPTLETATVDLLNVELQESCSQSSTTTIKTPSNSISDSIWAPEAAESTPENDTALMTQTDRSDTEVQDLGDLDLAAIETSTPASLSDSIWAPKSGEIILEEDIAPIVTPPPREEAASGLQASIWAVVSDDLNASVSTGSSSSLSGSIWASEPTEVNSENVVAPTPLLAKKVSGLQGSIWATVADVPKVVAPPVTSTTPPPRSTTPDVPKVVTPPSTLPTPPPSARKALGIKASIWADDTSASSTSTSVCEEDLFVCERRNHSVSASRWANAPDTPSTSRLSSTRKGNANRWKGRRGRSFCA